MVEWHKFEKYCEKIIRDSFDEKVWKISAQRRRVYADGASKRMDFHVRRRRAHEHYVFDSKYYIESKLSTRAVRDTHEYKRRSRASRAFVLCSVGTEVAESALKLSEKLEVPIIKLDYRGDYTRGIHYFVSKINFINKVQEEIYDDDDSWWKFW